MDCYDYSNELFETTQKLNTYNPSVFSVYCSRMNASCLKISKNGVLILKNLAKFSVICPINTTSNSK